MGSGQSRLGLGGSGQGGSGPGRSGWVGTPSFFAVPSHLHL